MNNLCKVFTIAALLVVFASTAFAEGYVGISGGVFMPNQSKITDFTGTSADLSYKTGYSISAMVGSEFQNGLRIESEFTYKNADFDEVSIAGLGSAPITCNAYFLGLMANGFYDFKNSSPLTPYVGGGIGFAHINVGQATSRTGAVIWNSDSDTVFAYQIGGGLGINVSKNVALDLGYRYYATSDPEFDLIKGDFSSHNITAGARFRF